MIIPRSFRGGVKNVKNVDPKQMKNTRDNFFSQIRQHFADLNIDDGMTKN